MSPIPCAHCGINFMRHSLDPEIPKLCHSCMLKEKIRKGEKKMESNIVSILIECPKEIHLKIEEYCINEGVSFSKYFLSLYEEKKKTNTNFEEEQQNYNKKKTAKGK